MTTGTLSNLGVIATDMLSFSQTLTKPWLFLHSSSSAYAVDGTNNSMYPITAAPITAFADAGAGNTTVTAGNRLVIGDSVTISGNPSYNGTYAVTVITSTSFQIVKAFVATGTGTFINVLSVGFPPNQTTAIPLTAGAAYLDGTTYVLTTTGRIYGSALEDPNQWTALNFISKSSEPDGGVAIAKHLHWIVAMGSWSTEFFYNAGNPLPGSPLSRNDGAKIEVGCANGFSVASFSSTVIWAGQARETGMGIFQLDGTSPIKISTSAVERLLNKDGMTNVRSFATTIAGHTLYGLSLQTVGVTLIYDLKEHLWYQWSSIVNGIETDFNGDYFVSLNGLSYVLNGLDGTLSILDIDTFLDGTATIPVRAVTSLIDGGVNEMKFFNSLELIGDRTNTSVLIRHSDDDYGSWTGYRTVSMNVRRPILRQLGAARRRAYEIYHTENSSLRIEGMELTVKVGDN